MYNCCNNCSVFLGLGCFFFPSSAFQPMPMTLVAILFARSGARAGDKTRSPRTSWCKIGDLLNSRSCLGAQAPSAPEAKWPRLSLHAREETQPRNSFQGKTILPALVSLSLGTAGSSRTYPGRTKNGPISSPQPARAPGRGRCQGVPRQKVPPAAALLGKQACGKGQAGVVWGEAA